MKSCYRRKDPSTYQTILRLPIDDDTAQKTISRMEAISKLWGILPNDPWAAGPFVAWPGMDKLAFDALLADARARQTAFVTTDQESTQAQANLNQTEDDIAGFVTDALDQGRNQFNVGTQELALINAVPIEPATQLPAKAVILVGTSPGSGQAHLECAAAHATSWDVLHKGPGDAAFTKVADDAIVNVYDASGLAAGNHEYKVMGRNSRGDGAESDVKTVAVA